jgi:hypothetical protein
MTGRYSPERPSLEEPSPEGITRNGFVKEKIKYYRKFDLDQIMVSSIAKSPRLGIL